MKRKGLEIFKNKPTPELKKELLSFRERFNSLKWDLVQGKVKNISELRQVKKSIAQILTILSKNQNQKK